MSEQAKTVKEIERGTVSFTANGKVYLIETKPTINRWEKYQELEIEMGYGMSVQEVGKKLAEAIEMLNKLQLVNASVALHSLATGVNKTKQRSHPAMRMCALFMNTADEDRTEISDELIMAKIADWKAEGIEAGFFLTYAQLIMHGSIENLQSDIPATPQQAETMPPEKP